MKKIEPYEVRLKKYELLKEKIFNENPISNRILNTRLRHKIRVTTKKVIESTVLDEKGDGRPYAKVKIYEKELLGLLDSGASVTVLGTQSLELLKDLNVNYSVLDSTIGTAGGERKQVSGKISLPVTFKNITKNITCYIAPSLQQPLYLGCDFLQAFQLGTDLFKCIEEISLPTTVELANTNSLTIEQKHKLVEIINSFPNFKTMGLGKTTLLMHYIVTKDHPPIKQKHWPYSPAMQKLVYAELDRMIEMGVVEESESPWNSPVVLVKKPGKVRLCLDSRRLNEVTEKLAYPLPHVEGLLSRLSDTHYISTVDLKDAFWQIPLHEASRPKTAFTVPGRGHFQFTAMPFGLCNAAQRMSQLMDQVIPAKFRDNIFIYLDDLLIVSPDLETHFKMLSIVSESLRKANLTINLDKSHFLHKEVKYLGFIVGQGVLKTDMDKIEAIQNFPPPKTIKQLRSFLGLAGWYRRFIRNFATKISPLTDCLQISKSFILTEAASDAFNEIKKDLTNAPVLAQADFSKPFFIQCDASTVGIGSVLYQKDENDHEHPIYFFSKKLNPAQRKYTVTELECLAAVLSVKKFRPFIEGQEFKILTDHSSLKWLMSQRDLGGRLARWSLKLQAFNFTIEHRKGKDQVVPDALSRMFCDEISKVIPLNLESKEFESPEYNELKKNIKENQSRLPDLKIEDEKYVFKRTFNTDTNEGSSWKLWVPPGLTSQLIQSHHEPPPCSHGGIAKTIKRLQLLFFWPNLTTQVKNFINRCHVCSSTKSNNKISRPPMGKQIEVLRPFQFLYLDFLGPYPRSKRGNSVILNVLDKFTKFPFLEPLKKATTSSVIEFLEKRIFSVFGIPEIIYTDNGVQFKSKLFKEFVDLHGITHLTTPIYTPQSNAAERVNRSAITAVRAYIEDHEEWDTHLHEISSALRSGYHQSIEMSPYFALFNQSMIQHGSVYQILKKINCLECSSALNILGPLEKSHLIREKIKNKLKDAHEKHEKSYNTRAKPVKFSEGQEIFYKNYEQSNFANKRNSKLSFKYLKGRVRKCKGEARYEIENHRGQFIGVFHAQDIKQG